MTYDMLPSLKETLLYGVSQMYSEMQAPAEDSITQTGGSSNYNGGRYETCAVICRVQGARHKRASGDWERKFPLKTKKYGRPNGYTIFNDSNWCTGV